ncbi:hypothetical protein PG985_000445 [Apiospora marii]|uniref:Luciferase domain-containing protein n=1 Tax=Apiospora marii TaxID=335849 RepID=A0ABR1R226_9PEZI
MDSLKTLPVEHPYLSASVAVAAPLLTFFYADYRAYVAMGPHGLPDNLQGYIKQLQWHWISRRDTTVPAPYDVVAGGKAKISPKSAEASERAHRSFFISSSSPESNEKKEKWELPARPAPTGSRPDGRPRLCPFVVPQRQLEGAATEAMKRTMNAYLDALAAANGEALHRGLSRLEGTVPAVQVAPAGHARTAAAVTGETRGEILHVHPADGSTHMLLSLADSRRVLETGWGSGTG